MVFAAFAPSVTLVQSQRLGFSSVSKRRAPLVFSVRRESFSSSGYGIHNVRSIVNSTYPAGGSTSPPEEEGAKTVHSTYPATNKVYSTYPGAASDASKVVESTYPVTTAAPSNVVESTYAASKNVHSTYPATPAPVAAAATPALATAGFAPNWDGAVATLSSPPGVFNDAVALGKVKAEKTVLACILMGIAAGAYIAIGCMMSLAIGGASPALQASNPGISKFIFGFVGQPWGLFMVLTTGAELFTGNSMLMTAAALRNKAPWKTVLAKWAIVFFANCIGALGVVWLSLKSQVVSASAASYVAALTAAKVGVPWEVAFLRGIGCNWIVCVGVLAAAGSRDLVGKFFCALAVVSMFVSLGFDQCIANMFFLPLGLACGADVTWKTIIMSNIIPVTLGNIVGGGILVGMVYHLVNKKKAAA